MKKKLLITTAALSLSVTSLAPVSSFAATHDNNHSKNEIIPIGYGEDRDKSALMAAQDLANDHMSGIIGIINGSGKKLGYLKGSKLEVPFHWNTHSFSEDKSPKEDGIKHTNGEVTLNWLRSLDDTIKATYVANGGKIIFERLENKNVSGIDLEIEDEYWVNTYIWWGGFGIESTIDMEQSLVKDTIT